MRPMNDPTSGPHTRTAVTTSVAFRQSSRENTSRSVAYVYRSCGGGLEGASSSSAARMLSRRMSPSPLPKRCSCRYARADESIDSLPSSTHRCA
eukprot:6930528-Prymnesium_polylepis.5